MGLCLCQSKGNPVYLFEVPIGGKAKDLSGMDFSEFEKYLWILKRYQLQPEISSVVVAVTDFIEVNIYVSDYWNIPGSPFVSLSRGDIKNMSFREIAELVEKKTP